MPASFKQLISILQQFEAAQVASLPKSLPTEVPHLSGRVQFVSVEPSPATARHSARCYAKYAAGDELEKPVIVGVGINYTQEPPRKPPLAAFEPFLRTPAGCPTILDFDPSMRRQVDAVLTCFRRNRRHWLSPLALRTAYASGLVEKVIRCRDYILIATNLSPFITTIGWSKLKTKEDAAIRGFWPHARHLDTLYELIKPFADLWMGHWPAHWPIFESWIDSKHIGSHMLTHNLCAPGGLAVRKPTHKLYPLYKPEPIQ